MQDTLPVLERVEEPDRRRRTLWTEWYKYKRISCSATKLNVAENLKCEVSKFTKAAELWKYLRKYEVSATIRSTQGLRDIATCYSKDLPHISVYIKKTRDIVHDIEFDCPGTPELETLYAKYLYTNLDSFQET